jgi:hypothetical protein
LASRISVSNRPSPAFWNCSNALDREAGHLVGNLREHGFERVVDLVGAHVLEADLADFDLERVERGLNVHAEHLGRLDHARHARSRARARPDG